jgi:hypothetical protein
VFHVAECDCHIPGVMGGLGVCDTRTGQCFCKPLVTSRRCDTCSPGTYSLAENNLFGCTGKNTHHFLLLILFMFCTGLHR